jgi:uncharacterized protein (DUF1501 family)
VQLGDTSPSGLLAGPDAVLAAESLKDFSLSGSSWLGPRFATALTALHQGVHSPAVAPAQITLAALDTAAALVKDDATPQNGATYPDTELGRAMADVARLVRGAQGLRAVSVDYGSWDMHQGLGAAGDGQMADHLGELAQALAAFAKDLGPTAFAGVTVITMSEFGRRVQENGSGGVDHGHGNALLVLGGGLNGGRVHGSWPGLDDASLDDGDLAGTTDYRSVLAELLVKRQGLSTTAAAAVFPGFTAAPVGVFR